MRRRGPVGAVAVHPGAELALGARVARGVGFEPPAPDRRAALAAGESNKLSAGLRVGRLGACRGRIRGQFRGQSYVCQCRELGRCECRREVIVPNPEGRGQAIPVA
jgi:hypothetical protein